MEKYTNNEFGFASVARCRIEAEMARLEVRKKAELRQKEIINKVGEETGVINNEFWYEITACPEKSNTAGRQILQNYIRKATTSTFLINVGVRDYIENDLEPAVESAASLGTESEDKAAAWAYVRNMLSDEIYEEVDDLPEDLSTEAFKVLTYVALIVEFENLDKLMQDRD